MREDKTELQLARSYVLLLLEDFLKFNANRYSIPESHMRVVRWVIRRTQDDYLELSWALKRNHEVAIPWMNQTFQSLRKTLTYFSCSPLISSLN